MSVSRASLPLRALVAGLGAVAIGTSIYALVAVTDPVGRPLYLRVLLSSAWSLGYGALAVAIAWRGPATRGVLLAGLFLAVMSTQSSLASLGVASDPAPAVQVFLIAFGGLGYAVGIRFTQSFPVQLSPVSLRTIGAGRLGRALLAGSALLLDARLFWPFVIAVEVVQHALFSDASAVWHALVYAGLASFYLWAGIKVASKADRRRAFWILEGVLVYLVLEALWAVALVSDQTLEISLPMRPLTDWLTVVEGWAALICFAIAIFFYGAFDSALVIRRTAVASLLGGLTLVLMVTAEELLADQVGAVTGIDTGAGAILGGVMAALAFRPLSVRLDRLLGRPSTETERA